MFDKENGDSILKDVQKYYKKGKPRKQAPEKARLRNAMKDVMNRTKGRGKR